MRKVIIFGLGKIFDVNMRNIDFSEVVCLVDNNPVIQYTKISGKLVIRPERIKEFEYDYIVIFNKNNRDEIVSQLVNECGVEIKKIISWQHYIYVEKYQVRAMSNEMADQIKNYIQELEIKSALDINGNLANNQMPVFEKNTVSLDCFWYKRQRNKILGEKYETHYDLMVNQNKKYDAIFALDLFLMMEVDEFLDLIKGFIKQAKYLFISLPYTWPEKETKWANHDFSEFGNCKVIGYQLVKLLVIELNQEIEKKDAELYIVTHKESSFVENKGYIPIYAGKTSMNELNILGDSEGDNIGYLNSKINEMTSLYWIWKNVKTDYVGIAHYRRYLQEKTRWNGKTQYLNLQKTANHLGDLEIIVGRRAITYPETVYSQLEMSLHPDAFEYVFYSIRNKINDKYPTYLQIFDDYFSGYSFYPCNLFFAKKELIDSYFEWIFDIIIEIAEEFRNEKYDSYSSRAVGFMAERLFSVWLIKNNIKVYENPISTGDVSI